MRTSTPPPALQGQSDLLALHARTDDEGQRVGNVVVRDLERVDAMLRRPNVRRLVNEGIEHARRVFGADTGFVLEMYDDPDGGDDTQLFVMMCTTEEVESAHELLARFDEEWWFPAMRDANGLLAFSLEFV